MTKLLKNKTFLLFFFGNVMSLIGFGFNLIAISWMVLEKTGSEYTLGKIMASATAPGLALALFAGVILSSSKWAGVSRLRGLSLRRERSECFPGNMRSSDTAMGTSPSGIFFEKTIGNPKTEL